LPSLVILRHTNRAAVFGENSLSGQLSTSIIGGRGGLGGGGGERGEGMG
jgi:hypothetical protein